MKKPAQFKVGKYVVVPKNSIFGVFLTKLFTPPVKHWLGVSFILALVLYLFIATGLSSVDIFFITFIFSTFFWNIDGRISIGLALLCLIAIMALTVLASYAGAESAKGWSETVAVWTYYFLVTGVLKQMWEHFREPNEEIVPNTVHGHTIIIHPTRTKNNLPTKLATPPPPKPKPKTRYHDIEPKIVSKKI